MYTTMTYETAEATDATTTVPWAIEHAETNGCPITTAHDPRPLKVAIPLKALKAMACLAPKTDVRYYLLSVCVEINPAQMRGTYVSTDGHVMGVHRFLLDAPAADGSNPDGNGFQLHAPRRILIPLDVIKQLPARRVVASRDYITLTQVRAPRYAVKGGKFTGLREERGQYEITAPYADVSITFDETEGSYPDWTQIMPTSAGSAQPGPAVIDPRLVAKFEAAAKAFGVSSKQPPVKVVTYTDAPGASRIRGRGLPAAARVLIPSRADFFGIVMPRRENASIDVPDWMSEAKAESSDMANPEGEVVPSPAAAY